MKNYLTTFLLSFFWLTNAWSQQVQLNSLNAPDGAYVSDYEINQFGQILAFELGQGLYFSPDEGATWETIPLDSMTYGKNIEVHPDGSFYMFFGKVIHKFDPNTRQLEKIFESNYNIRDLKIDENGTLFRAEVRFGTTIYKSENSGADWQELGYISSENYLYCDLFVPKGSSDIYVNSFSKNLINPNDQGILALFKINKTDSVSTVHFDPLFDFQAQEICGDGNGKIWINFGSEIHMSENGGDDFERIIFHDRNKPSMQNLLCLDNGELLLRSRNANFFGSEGFYKSSDQGQNWTLSGNTNYELSGEIKKLRYFPASDRYFANASPAGAMNMFSTPSDFSDWRTLTPDVAGAISTKVLFNSVGDAFIYDISGEGTVRFMFNNIMLPDSNINEAASNGFVKYKIAMKKDIPIGAEILNDADIYFDFNAPIRTNETFHLVDEPWVFVKTSEVFLPETAVKVYPNPFSESAILELKNKGLKTEFTCRIFDLNGKTIFTQESENQQVKLKRNDMPGGIYFYEISGEGTRIAAGKLVIK